MTRDEALPDADNGRDDVPIESYLLNWLDESLSDTDAADRFEHADEFLQSADRVENCARLIGRVWPASDSNRGETPQTELRQLAEGDSFGRFRIRGLLGRGGMGNVFRAFDPVIGRDVALKIPHPGLLLDPQARERFAREARAAGMLRHPNIVPLLESGDVGPVCYLAFEYCPGEPLSDWLRNNRELLTVPSAVRIAINIAEAIQHAHDRGVIHRDLKPSNVLFERVPVTPDLSSPVADVLAQRMGFVPRITDFGLARLASTDSTLTRTGEAVGTAEYMAPEQSNATEGDVNPACDQFSIGVILYQLLTGVSPFRRIHLAQTLAAVQNEYPDNPSRVNRQVSRDLDAVCLKALSKDPDDRYATAGEFADDLLRYLTGEPTKARPLSPLEQAGLWCRRNRLVASAAGVCFTALLCVCLVSWFSANRVQTALGHTRNLLYSADVRLAGQALANGNSQQAHALLSRHIDDKHQSDRFAWQYLWGLIHKEQAVVQLPDDTIPYFTRFTPNGRYVVASDGDGQLFAWDLTDNRLKTLPWKAGAVQHIACSKQTGNLMLLTESGSVLTAGIGDAQPATRDLDVVREMACGQVDPERNEAVTADSTGLITVRSVSGQSPVREIGRHAEIRNLALSPDGRWIVSAGRRAIVYLWDRRTGERIHAFRHSGSDQTDGRNRRFDAVTISPNSQIIAVGAHSGEVILWGLHSRQVLGHYDDHTNKVYDLQFSPDSRHLASCSKDSTIRLWNVSSGAIASVIQGHGRPVYSLCFSPDGKFLATGGKDGSIRNWNLQEESFQTKPIPYRVSSGQLARRGNRLFAAMPNGRPVVQTMNDDSHEESQELLPFRLDSNVIISAISSNEEVVAFASNRLLQIDATGEFFSSDSTLREVDVDGDGDLDRISAFGRWRHLVWQENSDDGLLAPPRLLDRHLDARAINSKQILRWSEDGPLVNLICQQNRDRIQFHSTAAGGETSDPKMPESLLELVGVNSVWPSDLDGDGDVDLLATLPQSGDVVWLHNDSQNRFPTRTPVATGVGGCVTISLQLRPDETEDVVVLTETGELRLIRLTDDLRLQTPQILASGIPLPAVLDACDFNGDGNADIMCATRENVIVLENRNGVLSPAREVSKFGNWNRSPASNVAIWDRTSRQLTHFFAISDSVHAMALSPDNQVLATGHRGPHLLRLWDTSDGQLLQTFPPIEETDGVREIAYSPDGKQIVFAAGDNAYVWDLDTGTILRKLAGHDNTVQDLAISPDGHYAATASHDYSVRIWDLSTGEQRWGLIGHEQRPDICHFSADGRTLISGGSNGEVILWDLNTGQQLLTLTEFSYQLMDVRFSEDGRKVIAAGNVQGSDEPSTRIGIWRATQSNVRNSAIPTDSSRD